MKKFLLSTWTWAFTLYMAIIFMSFVAAMPMDTPQPPVIEAECKLLIDEVTPIAGDKVHITVPNDWLDFTKDPFAITFDFKTTKYTGLVTFGGMVDEDYTDYVLYYMMIGDITKKYKIVPYGLWYKQTYYGIRKPGDCPELMDEAAFDAFDGVKQREALRLNTAQPS